MYSLARSCVLMHWVLKGRALLSLRSPVSLLLLLSTLWSPPRSLQALRAPQGEGEAECSDAAPPAAASSFFVTTLTHSRMSPGW